MGGRLPAPAVLARLLAVRRHRHRAHKESPHEEANRDRRRTAAARCRLAPRPRRRAPAAAGGSGAQGPALRLPRRRDRLRSGAGSATSIRASSPRTSSRRLYRYDYLRAARRRCVPHTAAAMPEVSRRLQDLDDPHPARHLLRRRPGLQGQAARARRGTTTSTRWKRLFDPANKSPIYTGFKEEGVLGVDELREEAIKRQEAVRLRPPRSRACARSTATPCSSSSTSRARASSTRSPTRSICGAVAREVVEFYGDEHRRAPGRHRAVPAGAVAAQLADRARAQPELPRGALRRRARRRRRRRPGDARADSRARALPMIDRVEISIIEESQPRWLALPQRRDRPADVGAARVRRPGRARTASSRRCSPSAACRWTASPTPTARSTTSTWTIRSSAATRPTRSRCAARSAWRPTSTREIRMMRRGQAMPAQSTVAPGALGYDPTYRSENSDYSPAARQGPARHLRLRRPRRRRLARAARRQAAGDRVRDQPDALSRQFDELWKKNMDAIGIRLKMRTAQVARAAEGGARRPADDLAARLLVVVARRAGRPADRSTARRRADRTCRASSSRASTRSTASMQSLPDGPERLALMHEARDLITAYMPQKYNVHRIVTWLAAPLGGRLARADVRQPVLAVRRHRRRRPRSMAAK